MTKPIKALARYQIYHPGDEHPYPNVGDIFAFFRDKSVDGEYNWMLVVNRRGRPETGLNCQYDLYSLESKTLFKNDFVLPTQRLVSIINDHEDGCDQDEEEKPKCSE